MLVERVTYLIIEKNYGEGTIDSPIRNRRFYVEEKSLELEMVYDPYTMMFARNVDVLNKLEKEQKAGEADVNRE